MASYKEKMLQRLKRAEELDVEVDAWEVWAEKKVREEKADILARHPEGNQRRHMELYYIEELLTKKKVYRNRAKVRDVNLVWAQVYGIAALVTVRDFQV
jgi:hypothetical protein